MGIRFPPFPSLLVGERREERELIHRCADKSKPKPLHISFFGFRRTYSRQGDETFSFFFLFFFFVRFFFYFLISHLLPTLHAVQAVDRMISICSVCRQCHLAGRYLSGHRQTDGNETRKERVWLDYCSLMRPCQPRRKKDQWQNKRR